MHFITVAIFSVTTSIVVFSCSYPHAILMTYEFFFHGAYPSLTRGMGIRHVVMATVSGAALCYNNHVYHLFPTDIATFNEVIELPISEMERLLR